MNLFLPRVSEIQLSGEAEYIKVVENYNEGFYNDSVVYALNEYKMESLYANITHVYNNDGRSIMTRWEFADGRIHEWYFNEIDENIEAACIYEVYRDADGNIIKEEGKLPQ